MDLGIRVARSCEIRSPSCLWSSYAPERLARVAMPIRKRCVWEAVVLSYMAALITQGYLASGRP
jgi:hypothetical protein